MKTDKTERQTEQSDNTPNIAPAENTPTAAQAPSDETSESRETQAMDDMPEPVSAETQAAAEEAAGEEAAGEKIPAHEEDEKRLTPVNPDLVQEKPAPAVGDKRGEATIAAIAAAMDIDVRIAHALVDIHAGVDSAEAFARAYGIDNPEATHTATSSAQAPTVGNDASRPDDRDRLPDDAKSVPTFLCNPRRGFWE